MDDNQNDALNFSLSRIDRSVADNLKDIDNSFDNDAKLVFDFILFMSKKLNQNLFGYTRFTIKEFSEFTGTNTADLCAIHPDIANGKVKPPIYEKHKFETVLEYGLYRMIKTNILFSKVYSYRDDGNIIKLENFPILKDIYLQSGKVAGTRKVYEVRLSDVMIEGFVERYYSLDTTRLPAIGRGKGGHSRKKVFVWLNKIFHIYTSKTTSEVPLFSVDHIADLAGVKYKVEPDKDGYPVEKEPKHKKESVSNILKSISKNINDKNNLLHFSFEYKFTNRGPNRYEEEYFVEFKFTSNLNAEAQMQAKIDHKLKLSVLKELRIIFDHYFPQERLANMSNLATEADSFQRWLNNNTAYMSEKVECLKTCYNRAHGWEKKKELKDSEAMDMIYNGFLELVPSFKNINGKKGGNK